MYVLRPLASARVLAASASCATNASEARITHRNTAKVLEEKAMAVELVWDECVCVYFCRCN
jgi:hypothetical protein